MSRWPGRLITRNPVTPGGTPPTASAPGIWTLPEMAYWKKQGLWPDASADAYWGYVSYLMATSSLSNANNNLFVDSSGAFNPVTRSGNTTQGAVTPYGTLWSNYFDGSSYLSAPASTAFAFGTGDFTVECWVNFMPGSAGCRITNRAPGGGAFGSWGFNFSPTTFTFTEVIGGEPGVSASGLPNMTNTWVHLAACRSGSTLRLFANGVLVGSGTNTTDFNNSSYSLGIGATYETAITGYLSNVRIVKGTALYTAAFTPPIAPLTAVAGTSILTCQSNRFRDNSSNAFALTITGTPRVVPSSPFILNAPGAVYNQSDISYWSGYFDGTSTSNALTVGTPIPATSDFTIQFWYYLDSASVAAGTATIIPLFNNFNWYNQNDVGIFIGYNLSTGNIEATVATGGGTSVSPPKTDLTSAANCLGTWTHIALVRSSATVRLFVNGAMTSGTLSSNTGLNVATRPFNIGGWYAFQSNSPTTTRYAKGYISNFGVNTTALYSAPFTPPSTPLTAVSGTSLLTCQNAAFTDNSTNNFPITVSGTTTVTGNNPYQSGYYSNYFDGSGDGLSISSYSSSALAFGTSDFTIEFWAFATTAPNNNWTPFFTMGTSSAGQEIRIAQNINGGGFGWLYPDNSNTGSVYAGYGAMTTNTWHHIAMTRSGSTMRLFLDGAVVATGTGVSFNFTNTTLLRIGLPQPAYADGAFTGYLSNLRIVKGTAVYTAAFTPPTAPLTAISGTGLLTCQANRLIDSSSNAFALTKVGDTSVVPFDPFYTATVASNGGSMYFDGDGDYLSLPLGVLPVIGNFTTETWFYRTSSANGILVYLRGGTASFAGLRIGVSSGGVYLLMTTSDGTWVINSGVVGSAPVGTWNHVAVVRNGGTITMYLNGTSIYSSTAIGAGSSLMAGSVSEVGRMVYSGQTSDFLPGYMSDTRITSGTALYTGNFTPPTAPLTPSGNTTLLLNGMNAGEYDAAMQNNFETIGNTQASSVQAKYGPTSAYFSGAVDNYITAPNSPAFQFGTNDLTIEAWIYLTGDTITNPDGNRSATICSGIGATGVSNDFWFNVTGNTTTTGTGLNFQVFNGGSGTVIFNTTYSFSKSTWYHVAFTRSGNNVYLFVNGTVVGSTTYSGTITAGTNPLRVGYGQTGSINYRQPFPGYIDDLRITKGVARYTSNFTPPTAALPIY